MHRWKGSKTCTAGSTVSQGDGLRGPKASVATDIAQMLVRSITFAARTMAIQSATTVVEGTADVAHDEARRSAAAACLWLIHVVGCSWAGLAALVGLFLIVSPWNHVDRAHRRYAVWLSGLAGLQLAFGVVNIVVSAPAWAQLVHLLLALLLWLALVRFALETQPRS